MNPSRPCVLIILDGWGIGPANAGNAVQLARTPFLDRIRQTCPGTRLLCSGEAVGLPEGIMGNSEVGHMNIGAGRVVYQDLVRIDRAIGDSSFYQNPVLLDAMAAAGADGAALHLMGLVSDGGVHSQLHHLEALIDMAARNGLKRVRVHAILDGRDTPPASGAGYLERLQAALVRHRTGTIASVCGRFYAMDRDQRWERVEAAYRLYARGDGRRVADPVAAVRDAYARGETDEFIKPVAVCADAGASPAVVRDGDAVVFFNFRADRAREITRAFTDDAFDAFRRQPRPRPNCYVCMTQYDATFTLPVVFPPVRLEGILGEVISRQGLRQLRIAETEKYAHVTYFFNGGEETPFPLEDRCLIPSPREVATYDLKPEMSAPAVSDEVIARLKSGVYAFVVLNFANMDMVGHTGVLAAAVKACETVDGCVARIVDEIRTAGGVALITADHGNSEKMVDENGGAYTAHTLSPVPLVLVDDTRRDAVLREGCLGDIAPTILELMGIEKPSQMTGSSLLQPHP
jgi:2,3-bisphosphoglycerate-independent phosphoglycerate mutase